jgi:type II secretory ATPase GspE/PulE/Tfp pilus assembly ATPase PilB-like protein
MDMHVEPFLIGASVIGVIAQRLLRKLCPHCAKDADISDELKTHIQPYVAKGEEYVFKKAVGCEQCDFFGYRGRTAIFEMMRFTPEIKDLVLKRASETEIEKVALAQGMRTLQMSALKKASQGITSFDEAMRVTLLGKE